MADIEKKEAPPAQEPASSPPAGGEEKKKREYKDFGHDEEKKDLRMYLFSACMLPFFASAHCLVQTRKWT